MANKNKGLIIVGLVGAGAIAYFFGKKALAGHNLNYKIRSINLNPISNAAIIFEVINPSNQQLSFDSITADISLDDNAVATVNYQKHTTIDANTSIDIPLKFKINPVDVASMLISKGISKSLNIKKIDITGTINGEGINLPIQKTINL